MPSCAWRCTCREAPAHSPPHVHPLVPSVAALFPFLIDTTNRLERCSRIDTTSGFVAKGSRVNTRLYAECMEELGYTRQ